MYEKQPYKILDLPSTRFDEGEHIFINTLHTAADIGGFDAMIPVTKFWIRQTLTIVQVWDVRFHVEGDEGALMPSYEWCVAAYEKMWQCSKNEVRNPLSEYPYMVRHELLRDIQFMRVFEECWKWIALATQGIHAQDFDPYEVRVAVLKYVLTLARNEFQPRNFSTQEELEKAFGAKTEGSGYVLLAERPVVYVGNLDNDLRERPSLHVGLCKEFYPHLPNMTQAEYEAMYPDSEDDSENDSDGSESDLGELELPPDVVVEAYGPLIDIAKFTWEKEPDAGGFCTWCQTFIALLDPEEQRCVVPMTCSDTFHAECLEGWVNGPASNSSDCPNCKVQMTSQQRPRRKAQ